MRFFLRTRTDDLVSYDEYAKEFHSYLQAANKPGEITTSSKPDDRISIFLGINLDLEVDKEINSMTSVEVVKGTTFAGLEMAELKDGSTRISLFNLAAGKINRVNLFSM
jgi:hypothetical protein